VLVNLPLRSLGQVMLGSRLREIGQTDGVVNRRPYVA